MLFQHSDEQRIAHFWRWLLPLLALRIAHFLRCCWARAHRRQHGIHHGHKHSGIMPLGISRRSWEQFCMLTQVCLCHDLPKGRPILRANPYVACQVWRTRVWVVSAPAILSNCSQTVSVFRRPHSLLRMYVRRPPRCAPLEAHSRLHAKTQAD